VKALFEIVAPDPGIDPRIRRALEFMRAHCGEHLALARVAEHVDLSAWWFEHLLKAATGVTFGDHLRNFRLMKAESLLLDWSLRIRQIAFSCGYESVPSFIRDFKRRYGMSPSQYRRRMFRKAA
jgi:transcriptional regulator GlxA family with amidase domain